MRPSDIRFEWLVERLATFDLTTALRVSLRAAGLDSSLVERMATHPTSKLRSDWTAFVAQATPADTLWYFRSPNREGGGRTGFAIVRDEVPVAVYITLMS